MNLGLLAGVCLLGCFAGSQNVSNEKEADFMSKMHQLGYSDQEINAFSAEKKQKFEKFDIIYSQSMESVMEDGESIEQIGERESKIDAQSMTDETASSNNSRTMKTILSYLKTGEGDYRFLLKTDVKWDSVPKYRISDIIGYRYDDVFALTKANGFPEIETHQRYHYHFSHYIKSSTGKATKNVDDKDFDIKHTGSDNGFYDIELQNHQVSFEFALPEDYHHSFHHRGNRNDETKEYTDFSYTVECFFTNTQTVFKTGGFQSVFLHKITKKEFDLGKLSFTYQAPFISYEPGGIIEKEDFDEGLSNYLIGNAY